MLNDKKQIGYRIFKHLAGRHDQKRHGGGGKDFSTRKSYLLDRLSFLGNLLDPDIVIDDGTLSNSFFSLVIKNPKTGNGMWIVDTGDGLSLQFASSEKLPKKTAEDKKMITTVISNCQKMANAVEEPVKVRPPLGDLPVQLFADWSIETTLPAADIEWSVGFIESAISRLEADQGHYTVGDIDRIIYGMTFGRETSYVYRPVQDIDSVGKLVDRHSLWSQFLRKTGTDEFRLILYPKPEEKHLPGRHNQKRHAGSVLSEEEEERRDALSKATSRFRIMFANDAEKLLAPMLGKDYTFKRNKTGTYLVIVPKDASNDETTPRIAITSEPFWDPYYVPGQAPISYDVMIEIPGSKQVSVLDSRIIEAVKTVISNSKKFLEADKAREVRVHQNGFILPLSIIKDWYVSMSVPENEINRLVSEKAKKIEEGDSSDITVFTTAAGAYYSYGANRTIGDLVGFGKDSQSYTELAWMRLLRKEFLGRIMNISLRK